MATAILDQWTEEKCLQLIREYRARPILWDQKDPFFFKKNMKPIAWEEIGEAINISADQCKHKMIILMSSFRREKAKIMHSMKNLSGDEDTSKGYKSTWFAFKEMAFLLDRDSERKRQLNESDDADEDDGESNIKLTMLRHHLETPVRPLKRAKRSMSLKRELLPTTEETFIQIQPMPGPSQTALEREEEIKSFTSFIGNKMKKYTDSTKNAVQQAICEIIFKADQNYYESHCYEKFTIVDDVLPHKSLVKVQNDSDSD